MNRVAFAFAAVLMASWGSLDAAGVRQHGALQTSLATASGSIAAFSLVDENGKSVTDEDFRGAFILVYFGYTYCPDVCPMGLRNMSNAVEALGPDADRVVPIFITVDPERDTREVLAAYTAHFHPRLIGMTGTREQIDAARKTYGVRSFKLFLPPSFDDEEDAREDQDENSRYLVQHSASTYLVGPDGRLERAFPHEMPPREMTRQIQGLVKRDH